MFHVENVEDGLKRAGGKGAKEGWSGWQLTRPSETSESLLGIGLKSALIDAMLHADCDKSRKPLLTLTFATSF
jgi:hypothetical protein